MLVKDYIGWLLVWNQNGTATEHYFPDKNKSACGRRKHPTTQPDAVYLTHTTCKVCKLHKLLDDLISEDEPIEQIKPKR